MLIPFSQEWYVWNLTTSQLGKKNENSCNTEPDKEYEVEPELSIIGQHF